MNNTRSESVKLSRTAHSHWASGCCSSSSRYLDTVQSEVCDTGRPTATGPAFGGTSPSQRLTQLLLRFLFAIAPELFGGFQWLRLRLKTEVFNGLWGKPCAVCL